MKNPSVKLAFAAFLIAAFPFSNNLFAQGSLGLHLSGANPIQNFADSNYKNNYGFNLEFMSENLLFQWHDAAPFGVHLGIRLDYHWAGSEKLDVILATPNSDDGTYRLANGNFGALGVLRLSGPDFSFRPYVDGFIGTRFFHTRETIKLKGAKSVEGFENTSTQSIEETWTFNGGLAIGAMYNITDRHSLDIRYIRSYGSNASFADLTTLAKEGNVPHFTTRTTISDQTGIQLGWIFKLDCDCNTFSDSSPRPRDRNIVTPNLKPRKPLIIRPNPALH